MKYDVLIIRKLLEAVVNKAGTSLDHSGLREASSSIPGLSSEYLYKKIYTRVIVMDDHNLIGIGTFQLNAMLEFLGYKNLDAFRSYIENPYGEQLMSLVGSYHCYVRANHAEGRVLKSPARIFYKDGILFFELHGKDHLYKGDMKLRDGILYILMSAAVGKTFHHVYKIGKRHAPHVMQGVFSGVSSGPDPIGGRTLMVRQDEPFEKLENRKLSVESMINSGKLEESRVGSYFKDYHNNNLSPFKSSDFGFDDLIPG